MAKEETNRLLKIGILIHLTYEAEDVLKQFFLRFGLLAGFHGAFWDYHVLIVQVESHRAKYDVHALLQNRTGI